MEKHPYSNKELMICVAARLFENGTTALIGTGLPMLAAMLALKTRTPDLVAMFEFGAVGSPLERLPRAVAESATYHKALCVMGLSEALEAAQRGFVDYGFLGGAQIDPYGNINSTVIGDHDVPSARLPGSGGANDIATSCWRTVAVMEHALRRFVPKVDFITTPGFLTGPGARERAGLPAGSGPAAVVSTLGLMDYDPGSCRMRLAATHPGVEIEEVVANTGFELLLAEPVGVNAPPTAEELRILREEIDPDRLYI